MATSELTSPSTRDDDVRFNILEIKVDISRTAPNPVADSSADQRFLVSASVPNTKKKTTPKQIERNCLHWNEVLSGFTLDPSSHLTLKVLKCKDRWSNKHLATFIIPYEKLRAPDNEIQIQASMLEDLSKESLSWDISNMFCRVAKSVSRSRTLPLQGGISFLSNSKQSKKPSYDPVSTSSQDDLPTIHILSEQSADSPLADHSPIPTSNSALLQGIVGPPEGSETVARFAREFLDKWKILSDKLDVLVSTLDTISGGHHYEGQFAKSAFLSIPETIPEHIYLNKDVAALLDAVDNALQFALANQEDDSAKFGRKSDDHEKSVAHMLNFIADCGYFFQFYVKDINFSNQLISDNIAGVIQAYRNRLIQFCDEGDMSNVDTIRVVLKPVKATASNRRRSVVGKTSGKSLRDQWEIIRARLDFIIGAVETLSESNVYPAAKRARSVISDINVDILERIHLDKTIIGLLDKMEQALDVGRDPYTLRARLRDGTQQKRFVELLRVITEYSFFVHFQLQTLNPVKRFTKGILQNEKPAFQDDPLVLRNQFLGTSIQKGKSPKEYDLPYGVGTSFNPEKSCLPGTRTKVIGKIINWVADSSSSQVLILIDPAGTGKSAIAHSVATILCEVDRLTTSYFFARGQPSSREPYRFFTTLARDLCDRYPEFKTALDTILESNPGLIDTRDYTTLFRYLILEPLEGLLIVDPVCIILDGLDECIDASSSGQHTEPSFHSYLGRCLFELPSNFRIFIASRPEPDIMQAFPSTETSFVHHIFMDSELTADEVDDDIRLYLRTKLQQEPIGDAEIRQLVKKAQGLFVWAAVASDYLANRPPDNFKRFNQSLLGPMDKENSLDQLYKLVLRRRLDINNRNVRASFQAVMGRILWAYEPLSISALNALHKYSGLKDTEISQITQALASLFSNINHPVLPIAPLHASLRDFLTDKKRSDEFHVDKENAHRQFALATLRTMQASLSFNICKVETSYRFNSEQAPIEQIPSSLSYSCRFWAEHLTLVSQFDDELFKCLQALMKENFLFWLEVVSLKGALEIAYKALLLLREWLRKVDAADKDDLDALVVDGITFVRYFGRPMARSAPHIYLSALPFTPSSSRIFQHYASRFSSKISLNLQDWPPLVMTNSTPNQTPVCCVAFSVNSQYFAAGLSDGQSYIWDASTGSKYRSFKVLAGFVSAIVFSHDGLFLASGLSTGRIYVWDLVAMAEAATQRLSLTGHTKFVSSLSFSTDGTLLVSGSGDRTVRIWDAMTGDVVAGPFGEHNNPIWMVALSPDMKYLVSRSGFRTLRIWDWGAKELLNKMPQGMEIPSGPVQSVIHYHSSGNFKPAPLSVSQLEEVVEEENDFTTRIHSDFWAQAVAVSSDGKLVATCDTGSIHVLPAITEGTSRFSCEKVMCLAFSEDSQQIVSGTRDGRVCLWNLGSTVGNKTALEIKPTSAAFSPNKQVVFGSVDGRVQVLSTSPGSVPEELKPESHPQKPIYSVVISMNGDWIASVGYEEEVILVGKMGTREPPKPLKAQDDSNQREWNRYISSLVFSPEENDILASGTCGGMVYLWNVSTGETLASLKHNAGQLVTCLAFCSPKKLAVAFASGHIYVWDTQDNATPQVFMVDSDVEVKALTPLDGERLVSVAEDCSLHIWHRGTVKGKLNLKDDGKVRSWLATPDCIALSRDGQIVIIDGKDHTVLVVKLKYDIEKEPDDIKITVEGFLLLAGHSSDLSSFHLSLDERYLTSTSYDYTIRVWDLQEARKNRQFIVDSGSMTFTDSTIIDQDGWATCKIQSDLGQPNRLLWIPEAYRALPRPSNICVRGQNSGIVLDLKNFVHGKEWVKCMSKSKSRDT